MTRVLFLGGLGRSGTTLLERVLGELPGVVALGEVVHLWQRGLRDGERCGCGELFRRCRFWTAVGDRAFGGWQQVDVDHVLRLQRRVERTRHVPRLAAAQTPYPELAGYTDHYRRIYTAAAQLTGAELVIDSSKHGALAWCLRHTAGLDLRVVHVLRDPRAVAYSWTRRVTRPERDGAELTRYRPGHSALLWTAQNAALALLARRGPTPVLRVHYEHFLADPVQTVREVAGFAGLDPTPADLAFLDRDRAVLGPGHSAAGNPMRFATGEVPLRPDDAWQHGLARRHRRLVGAVCAPLLAAYGYPLRVRKSR